MLRVSAARKASRTHVWLESLGDWAWPGRPAPPEPLPPAWVPAVPAQLEPALAGAGYPESVPWRLRATPRGLLLATLLSALAAVCVALAVKGSLPLEGALGIRTAAPPAPSVAADAAP